MRVSIQYTNTTTPGTVTVDRTRLNELQNLQADLQSVLSLLAQLNIAASPIPGTPAGYPTGAPGGYTTGTPPPRSQYGNPGLAPTGR